MPIATSTTAIKESAGDFLKILMAGLVEWREQIRASGDFWKLPALADLVFADHAVSFYQPLRDDPRYEYRVLFQIRDRNTGDIKTIAHNFRLDPMVRSRYGYMGELERLRDRLIDELGYVDYADGMFAWYEGRPEGYA